MADQIIHLDCGCMSQYRNGGLRAKIECGRDNCARPATQVPIPA